MRRALGVAAAVYVAGVAAFAAFAVWTSATDHFRDLYGDDWVILAQRGEQPFWRWLVSSHNGHLIPLTRLLFHVDLEWLGGRGMLPTAVSLLATAAAAGLLWLPVRASRIEPASLRTVVGAFLAFCVIHAGLLYGLLWGFSAHAPLMAAWLALAVAAGISYAVEDPPRRRPSRLLLAFAGAVGASVSCATGVGAWAALLAIAVAARLPWRVLAAIAGGGAACALLVVAAPMPPAAPGAEEVPLTLSPWLTRPDVLLRFALRYLGTPFAWPADSLLELSADARTDAAFAAGAIGLAGALVHVVLRLRAGRIAESAGLLGLALMAFGVAAATVTSVGRAGGFQPVNYRFTPFALVFWMGAAVALAAPAGAARWRAGAQRALVLALPCVSLLFLNSLGPRLDHQRERRDKVAAHTLMLVVGIRGDGVAYVLANSKHARAVVRAIADLEARGKGPFADPRRELLGRPLAAAGIEAEPPPCDGRIRGRRRLSGRQGNGESIEGTLRADPERGLPVSLVVAGGDRVIRGLGDVLRPRDGQAEWYAYRTPRTRDPARVYGVFGDGSACVLAPGPR